MFGKLMRKRLSCSDPDVMDGLKKAPSSPTRKRRLINNNSVRVAQLARIAADYQLSLVQRKIASRQSIHDEECVEATKSVTHIILNPTSNVQLEQDKENTGTNKLSTEADGDWRKSKIKIVHELERDALQRIPLRQI